MAAQKPSTPASRLFDRTWNWFWSGGFFGGNRLTHEAHKALIIGTASDVRAMMKLDYLIGRHTAKYQGNEHVPRAVVEELKAHVADLKPVFNRVSAYEKVEDNTLESQLRRAMGEPQEPEMRKLSALEYFNCFTSAAGNEIRSPVVTIYLKR